MADNDEKVLGEAKEAVYKVDLRYKAGNLDDKVELKKPRDKLFSAYVAARIDLLEDGVIATEEDVQNMRELRKEIDSAADSQQLAISAINAAKFLIKFI